MGTYYKNKTIIYHSINDNIKKIETSYKLKDGYFGKVGKSGNSNIREIDVEDPINEAKNFYTIISSGGVETNLPKNNGLITRLKDGTIIVYREITSTPNSPAVEINISNSNEHSKIKSQKIHFERKKENENNK